MQKIIISIMSTIVIIWNELRDRDGKNKNEQKSERRKSDMAANVETMFSVREKPWHGLGVVVEDAPSSKDA